MPEIYENPKKVILAPGRWDVKIKIQMEDGWHVFVASADRGLTEGSSIWFGTEEEHEKDMERLW